MLTNASMFETYRLDNFLFTYLETEREKEKERNKNEGSRRERGEGIVGSVGSVRREIVENSLVIQLAQQVLQNWMLCRSSYSFDDGRAKVLLDILQVRATSFIIYYSLFIICFFCFYFISCFCFPQGGFHFHLNFKIFLFYFLFL